MLQLNLQFFASKKGVGSTKNGRDSISKRLGAKRNAVRKFTQVKTSAVVATTHCLQKLTA